jgi:hypothetical protein
MVGHSARRAGAYGLDKGFVGEIQRVGLIRILGSINKHILSIVLNVTLTFQDRTTFFHVIRGD